MARQPPLRTRRPVLYGLIWTICRSISAAFWSDRERTMRAPMSSAKARLTELVRRAEAGEEVVLTRRGQAVVRLVPLKPPIAREDRRKLLDDGDRPWRAGRG
jgi:prevent-host-death family protein